ncbi:MAG: hypothetical protein KBG28_00385 [Kofleriaceae bacterium]|jgi:hypothetical protein|nr:hypothetical protein [Kofleriaceae bacterium]MBP6838190.1 hypothetical protein [Kofleriaceae bacterium]MBP6840147.1 hypothetical protein [Kofleriaceae bacterium]MBP9202405.1 hypothetical protein [Kofleriaceae bacterium]
MKKTSRKLRLDRLTVRTLADQDLGGAAGAGILSAMGMCSLLCPPQSASCLGCLPSTQTCIKCPESVNTCPSICDVC